MLSAGFTLARQALKSAAVIDTTSYYGLTFDGGDYATFASPFPLDVTFLQFCVSAWVKHTGVAGYQVIFSQTDGTAAQSHFQLRLGNETGTKKLQLFMRNEAGANVTVSSTNAVVPANTWTHVAMVHHGLTMVLYVNAVMPTGGIGTMPVPPGKVLYTMATIGAASGTSYGAFFTGKMASLRIWSNHRSEAQIAATMYTTRLGPTADLHIELQMQPGSGTTVTDSAGVHGHNATFAAGAAAPTWTVIDNVLPPVNF